MKAITAVVASFLVIVVIGYLGLGAVNEHIDRESGAIVEETLSDNTISQLKLLSELQLLIKFGEVDEANARLSESKETLVFILKKNCTLPKCEEALRNYQRR